MQASQHCPSRASGSALQQTPQSPGASLGPGRWQHPDVPALASPNGTEDSTNTLIFHAQPKPGLALLLKDEAGMSGTADNGLLPARTWLEAVQQLFPKTWESTLGWVQGEHAALRANAVVARKRAAGGNSIQRMGTTHSCGGNKIILVDQLRYSRR